MLPEGTHLGALTLDQVFIEYDGPQLFSCLNSFGHHFLAMHAPPEAESDNWIYVYISPPRLHATALGLLSLREVFAAPELGTVEVVTFNLQGTASAKTIAADRLPVSWLPDEGEYLSEVTNPPSARASMLGAWFETRSNSPDSVLGPQRRFALSFPEYIRSIRAPVQNVADLTGRAVFDLMLKPSGSPTRTDVPISLLGSLLSLLQRLVDALAPGRGGETPQRGPVPWVVRSWTQLDAVAVFPSSFGLRVETHQGSLDPSDDGKIAISRLAALLNAGEERGLLRELLLSAGRRSTVQYRAFTRVLANSDADFAIDIGLPGAAEPQRLRLSRQQVQRISAFLDEESTAAEITIEFVGRLVAISLRTKFFRLESEDGQVASGRIAEACVPLVYDKKINAVHRATLRVSTEVSEISGETIDRYTLERLDELDGHGTANSR